MSYQLPKDAEADAHAVEQFQAYLRVRTDQPEPDYDAAISFLRNYSAEFGMQFESFEVGDKQPVGLVTVPGTDPSLPSILLNSHMDVVPVFADKWTIPPFSGEKDAAGNILGRGTQDMKCVTMQHIEAVGRLVRSGAKFARTIHMSFVPDEEIGGPGMSKFVETQRFKDLNVGLALDEGLASEDDTFTIFYGERLAWWAMVRAEGPTGHGSRFVENTAVERIHRVMERMLAFRTAQQARQASENLRLGDVTTLNVTALEAGVRTGKGQGDGAYQLNVIPEKAQLGVDMRVTPEMFDEVSALLRQWVDECGCTLEFVEWTPKIESTAIGEDQVWWRTLAQACKELDIAVDPQIFPAATDSRYLRKNGYPCFGFSPMNNTPILLHDHDELLHEDVFVRGIYIFQHLIASLANQTTPA